jgi:Spy/CpxP family protein refolding chaperone
MRSNIRFSRMLAGTVLAGSLAFAAQAQAQQQGQAGQAGKARVEGGRGEQRDPAQMVERRVTRLTEQLKLSTSQTTAIRQILLDEQTQMQALRPEGGRGLGGPGGPGGRGGRVAGDSAARGERRQRPDSGARAQRQRPDSAMMAKMRAEMEQNRTQVDALRKRTDARIEAVLNAEQRTTYRELVANRPEGGMGRGGPGGGRGPRGGDRQAPPPAK